jgi:hypothetical protein
MKLVVDVDVFLKKSSSARPGNVQIDFHHWRVHGETELEMLFQQGLTLHNASKCWPGDERTKGCSGSLRVLAEKCKGVKMQKWENESILFDWGCS